MADDQHYDVVIIGTGAGGGTLGHRLATSGARCSGSNEATSCPRERDNWETQAVFVRGKYLAPEVWYDGHGHDFQPEVNYYVGGNTKFYGAALFRLRPEDFGELRHHGGISPAWPISYDDLEPYYTQAEHLYLVHGEHGEDPSEGHASAQYAHPPVSHEPRIQQLSDDLEKLGLHPFHLPIGVNLQEAAPGVAAHGQRLHPLRPGGRLPVPARRQVGRAGHLRRPGPRPGQRHPRDRRPRAAPRDGPVRSHRHRCRRHPGRRLGHHVHRRHRGGRVWCGELRGPAAEVSQRSPPGRAGQQLGRGRPALHAAQQRRPDGRLARAQPHDGSRRRWR